MLMLMLILILMIKMMAIHMWRRAEWRGESDAKQSHATSDWRGSVQEREQQADDKEEEEEEYNIQQRVMLLLEWQSSRRSDLLARIKHFGRCSIDSSTASGND
jgi:hypothetical protein